MTFWSLGGIIKIEREKEIFKYYRRLKNHIDKLDDSKLTKLVDVFERKFSNYLAREVTRKKEHKMKTQKINLGRLTRSEIRDYKKHFFKFGRNVLKLKPKDAQRVADIATKASKEAYEDKL